MDCDVSLESLYIVKLELVDNINKKRRFSHISDAFLLTSSIQKLNATSKRRSLLNRIAIKGPIFEIPNLHRENYKIELVTRF